MKSHDFSLIKCDYHLKVKTALKEMMQEIFFCCRSPSDNCNGYSNIVQAFFKFKKSRSCSINDAYIRFSTTILSRKNQDLTLLCATSSHLIFFIY
jgi:hypothetical protein